MRKDVCEMIDYEETRIFYETTNAWDTDLYGTYTPAYIRRFITRELDVLPVDLNTKILNAGSGGTEYYGKGSQYHIDLAGSKLKGIKNSVAGCSRFFLESWMFFNRNTGMWENRTEVICILINLYTDRPKECQG